MKAMLTPTRLALIGMICCLLFVSALFAGCTQSTTTTPTTATPTEIPATPVPTTVEVAPTAAPTTVAPTATPAPSFTPSANNLVVYTAASLTGASKTIGSSFTKAYPSTTVSFDLDGTQALKTQVENGAYADVFISASNSYTNTLKSEGYFVDGTVQPLATNYIIVILPPANTANIQSLADLAKPGVKIAIEQKAVPAGTATLAVIGNLANDTLSQSWANATMSNVVTQETSEPAVAAKVALGEVDAGFVYQSTATAAPSGTYTTLTIPQKDNYLQTYTIGILKGSQNKAAAAEFEQYMLSSAGQQILAQYGFSAPPK
ncbi:MAG: molybdate ABC transporter substrate-binding protein [Methanoregula sp.]|uniref:molybdate ABC transporter substrate-binding protein n=1 Tax=Methanoregula sp. TaxID=2052170 RepID=UPI003BB1C011